VTTAASEKLFMATKNIWRAQMLETRSQLGPDKISQLNRDLCKNLSFVWTEAKGFNQGPSKNRPLWAGYKSFSWEADPQLAIIEASPFIRWAFPRVLPNLQMEFLETNETLSSGLTQSGTRWLKNSWGIWEPDPQTAEKISLDDCLGVLVPAVAFDRQGHRLGYGKGFYDRALANYRGLKVGVGFSMQLTSTTLPNEVTDVTMDLLVTDKEIIRVKAR
jgi:5-formyltetrahydrofolate cyclo-ligase